LPEHRGFKSACGILENAAEDARTTLPAGPILRPKEHAVSMAA